TLRASRGAVSAAAWSLVTTTTRSRLCASHKVSSICSNIIRASRSRWAALRIALSRCFALAGTLTGRRAKIIRKSPALPGGQHGVHDCTGEGFLAGKISHDGIGYHSAHAELFNSARQPGVRSVQHHNIDKIPIQLSNAQRRNVHPQTLHHTRGRSFERLSADDGRDGRD